jgi:hypothetical protein
VSLLDRFYRRLPVRPLADDPGRPGLSPAGAGHLRRVERRLAAAAAALAGLGFLAYYLPVYRAPHLFPAASVAVPLLAQPVRLAWGELLWCAVLGSAELGLLLLLNVAGAHRVAVATGFIAPRRRLARAPAVLAVGVEARTARVRRLGIDPFEGLSPWLLLLFNLALRLKGWLGNQAVRYLVRLLAGRYAVRTLLDFAGLPLYMAINAYSVRAVMREARVAILGRAAIRRLREEAPRRALADGEKALLYDTLQFVAVSKRDFHRNHYLLARELLARCGVAVEPRHPLPPDYPERLRRAAPDLRALCRSVIVLGFVLDGHLSWRERLRLRRLDRLGVLPDGRTRVRDGLRAVLAGAEPGTPPA